ncbi:MAG: EAL domain-containing protein [Gammaproteobacteria bacterium]|nr:EAL domain-containing protein [Gammaproteobacteria bacterium]
MTKKSATPRPTRSGTAALTADFLRDSATQIAANGDPDFFASLVRYLAHALAVDCAYIAEFIDASTPRLRTIALCIDGKIVSNVERNLKDSPAEHVLHDGVCFYRHGIRVQFPRDTDLALVQAESYIGIPLFSSSGQCIGLLTAVGRKSLPDDPAAETIVHILAARAAAELERRRAQDRVLRVNRLLRAMREISKMVTREGNEERVYAEICRLLVEHGGFHMVWISLTRPSGRIQPVAQAGITDDYLERLRLRYDESADGQGPTVAAIQTGRYAVHADLASATGEWAAGAYALGCRSCAAFPLYKGGHVTGTINIYAAEPAAFAHAEIDLLESLVSDISQALQLRQEALALHQSQAVLQESQRMFTTLLSNLPGMAYRCRNDKNWTMEFVSDGSLVLTGYPASDFIGNRVRAYNDVIDPLDQDRIWQEVQAAVAVHLPFQFSYRIRTADGQQKWVWEQGRGVFAPTGELLSLEGFIADITERMHADDEMRKLSSVVHQTADCIMITDRNGNIEYVNTAFEQITGYSQAEAIGHKPSLLKSGLHDADFYERVWQRIGAGETVCDVFINRKKNGELYYEEKTISPLRDGKGEEVTHFISTGKDITDRLQAQERLQYLAHHDALTGLPNRVLFLDRLNQALIRAHSYQRSAAILFLDLDRFKNINDTLGHDIGDALLKTLAERLQERVREGDSVARLGGDEFAVLLEDMLHVEDVSIVATKMLEVFEKPFVIQSHEFYLTASIGISLYPNDGATAAALVKNADTAMYRAKDVGKNNFQFYSADMSAAAFERLTLETSLRRALERQEFVLHYQPQIELASGRVIGMEALVRWQHPEFGLLSPAHFISLAEETGAIVALGEWVMRTAMIQAQRWRDTGCNSLRMAVNVSGRQFTEPGFDETVAELLRETGLPADALEIEITESVIMANAEKMIERLRVLHKMGVHFAIDDFGTGYSSLSYLRRFPIQTLKIDKSFIHDLTEDSGDAEIAKTVIAMARGLKLAVVAEGVETREQLLFLQAQGCYAAQGYLISRPMPVDKLGEQLRDGYRWLGNSDR